MSDILTDLSSRSLSGAIKANFYSFNRQFQLSSCAETNETAELFRWQTSVRHDWFNGVWSLRPPDETTAAVAREQVAYFEPRAPSGFTWWWAPELDGSDFARRLAPLGFRFDQSTPGMAIDLATLRHDPPAELEIQVVETSAAFRIWTSTFLRGFVQTDTGAARYGGLFESLGLALPFRYLLGLRRGVPVATASFFLGAGVAGLYNVATVVEARGRGYGAAMTTAALSAARDLGYRAGILQATEMGYPVYTRLGFQELCRMEHLAWGFPGPQREVAAP